MDSPFLLDSYKFTSFELVGERKREHAC